MDTSIGLKTAKNKKSSPEQINALLEKIGTNSDSSAVDLDELIGKGDALEALLAKHPNTNAQTLKNLSLSTSRLTCRNVVLNPNTPKDVLLNLAPRFPGDFFKNPMFDWFFLEDPDLFTKLEKGVLKNILKRGECPESFLRWAAKNGDFQERLAATMNPKAPNDLLALLAEQDDSIGILAKAMVEIKPELLINLRDRRYFYDREGKLYNRYPLLEDILKNPGCQNYIFQWAAEYGTSDEKFALMANNKLPIELFKLIIFQWPILELQDSYRSSSWLSILRRSDCPIFCIEWAISHHFDDWGLAMAENPNIPAEIVRELAARKGALLRAVKAKSVDAVKALIGAGADVNYQDKGGNTALVVAGEDRTNFSIIEMLLDAGAMPASGNSAALRRAISTRALRQSMILLERGAQVAIAGSKDFEALRDGLEQIAKINPSLLKSRIDCETMVSRLAFDNLLAQAIPIATPIRLVESSAVLEAADEDLPEMLRKGVWTGKLIRRKSIAEPIRMKNISRIIARAIDSYAGDFKDVVGALPLVRLKVSGKVLPKHSIDILLRMMMESTFDAPIVPLQTVLAACDSNSISEFSWWIFERWIDFGSEKDSNSFFQALGYMGGVACVRKLTRHVLSWSKGGFYLNANIGIEIINFIGGEVACLSLIEINHLHSGVDIKAWDFIKYSIPHLGLSAKGDFIIEVNDEKLIVTVDEKICPILTDFDGTRLKDLPSSRFDMKSTAFRLALERWSTFCADTNFVAKRVLPSLEDSMNQSTRWSGVAFKNYFVGQPLLLNVVSGIVWRVYSRNGFSVDENFVIGRDGVISDHAGFPVLIPDDSVVGIPHPVQLGLEIGIWDNYFSKRKIRQPFSQLSRIIFKREDDKQGNLFGFEGATVSSMNLKALDALGVWTAMGNHGQAFAYSIDIVHNFHRKFYIGQVRIDIGPAGWDRHGYRNFVIQEFKIYIFPVMLSDDEFSELFLELNIAFPHVLNNPTLTASSPPATAVVDSPVSSARSDSTSEFAVLEAACPNCEGEVKDDGTKYACCGSGQATSGCGFSFNKTQAGRMFNLDEVEHLIRYRKSGKLKGFVSKAGKSFSAEMVIVFDEKKKSHILIFDFVKARQSESTTAKVDLSLLPSFGACPKCKAAVLAIGADYLCANSLVSSTRSVPSCDFKTGQVMLQRTISREQIGKLLASGRTDFLEGFMSSRTGKEFTASLFWDQKAGKISFEFPPSRAWVPDV